MNAKAKRLSAVKLLAALFLAALVVVSLMYLDLQGLLRSGLDWVSGLGHWGPVAFAMLYVVAAILFVPGSLLTLGAGVIFGVVKGSAVVIVSATLAAASAFLCGRYLARDWVAGKIEKHPGFRAIDEAVAVEGWKVVGLTRLSPVFPFNLLNYGFGITRVSFRDYVLASFVGMIPGTVMYVYIGSLAGDLAALGASGRTRTTAEWVLYVIGLAATVTVTVYVTRLARRALDNRIKKEPSSPRQQHRE